VVLLLHKCFSLKHESRRARYSVKMLAVCVEAVRPELSSLIHGSHRLVSRVPWHFHLIVLNDVLLDNGVSGAQRRGLLHGTRVEVRLRDKTVVAGDMRCRFGCADCQLMVLIDRRFGLLWQFRSWVVPIRAQRHLVLGVEVAALGCISLAIITPQWAL